MPDTRTPAASPSLGDSTLEIRPWTDPVVDELGHDLRSFYVERYWLGILGPSTTLLLRRLANGFDVEPDGFTLHLADTARALGLGARSGRHSPFLRALDRMCQFGMARRHHDQLDVRRRLPPLTRLHLARLPESLQAEHAAWERGEQAARPPAPRPPEPAVAVTTAAQAEGPATPPATPVLDSPADQHPTPVEPAPEPAAHMAARDQIRAARRLARELLGQGRSVHAVEAALHDRQLHPARAHDARRGASEGPGASAEGHDAA